MLGLPTGSSPIGTYRKLIEFYQAGRISFEHVITFNMDEYVGIPEKHPESYHSFMWKHLFSHIDIKKEHVNMLNGNAKDLKAECDLYEEKILSYGGINLFVGGIGSDGHIAFNEPGSSLTSRTRLKSLNEETLIANSRFFGGDIRQVPSQALTVGIQTIMDANELLLIVNGANKATAVQKTIEEGISHMWPSSILQMHDLVSIVCDEKAVYNLKVKTVKYFQGC